MKDYKLQISEGYRDIFGKEMLVKKEIEKRLLSLFKSFGYELIKTPTVEYIDVYSNDGLQKPDVYNLINRQGEVLALCNDMTSSIARFVSSNPIEPPLKYCYSADVFRYPKQYQGKNHQFLQGGIEIIGDDSIQSDVESIYLGYKCLKNCGINTFTIHIGSAEFLSSLFEDLHISEKVRKEITLQIERKNYVELENILKSNLKEEEVSLIIDLMLRGGRLTFIEGLLKKFEKSKSFVSLNYLKNLYLTLQKLGVESILFDFSIYSYASYYTGIIFSFYVDGVSKAILEGGRCADLFKSFGKNYNDVGFGIDIDALTSYVLIHNLINCSQEKYLSFSKDEDLTFANLKNEDFRNKKIVVNHLHFSSLKDAIDYAQKNKYDKVIEYKGNTFKLWEVETC